MHIYNWYHSDVTSILYVHEHVQWIIEQSPCFLLPLLLHSLLLPIRLPLLTWNPPCCDRIRPPRYQVACKLIFPFPSPCLYTPHSKIPTPRSFPDPNVHSLGRHRESGSQEPAQVVFHTNSHHHHQLFHVMAAPTATCFCLTSGVSSILRFLPALLLLLS
jgi:hypothetical protein